LVSKEKKRGEKKNLVREAGTRERMLLKEKKEKETTKPNHNLFARLPQAVVLRRS